MERSKRLKCRVWRQSADSLRLSAWQAQKVVVGRKKRSLRGLANAGKKNAKPCLPVRLSGAGPMPPEKNRGRLLNDVGDRRLRLVVGALLDQVAYVDNGNVEKIIADVDARANIGHVIEGL